MPLSCSAVAGSGARSSADSVSRERAVIFTTAHDEHAVEAFELEAIDYLIKPFHLDELLARVHALLRRDSWAQTPPSGRVAVGGGWIDLVTREAEGTDGSQEALAAKEFEILRLLVLARGQVVSRAQILTQVWGGESDPTPRTVDNFVVRLRKRFEPDPEMPRYFHTVRGVGYRFTREAPPR